MRPSRQGKGEWDAETGQRQPQHQDHEALGAGRKAVGGREAGSLGPCARVADQERAAEGQHREHDRDEGGRGLGQPEGDDADVDDGLTGPVQGAVQEAAERRAAALRPGQSPVHRIQARADGEQDGADEQELLPDEDRCDRHDDEAEHGDRVGRHAGGGQGLDERGEELPPGGLHPGGEDRVSARRGVSGHRARLRCRCPGWPQPAARRRPAGAARQRAPRRRAGRSAHSFSRPCRRVSTRPAVRRTRRCQLMSGWERPKRDDSSFTGSGPDSPRMAQTRRRVGSASARYRSRRRRRSRVARESGDWRVMAGEGTSW